VGKKYGRGKKSLKKEGESQTSPRDTPQSAEKGTALQQEEQVSSLSTKNNGVATVHSDLRIEAFDLSSLTAIAATAKSNSSP
jgi:hypothetical protein